MAIRAPLPGDRAQVAVQLAPGVLFAGLNRPPLFTQWMFEQQLRMAVPMDVSAHLKDFRWYPRQQPPPVDPRRDPRYKDDWSEWFSVTYDGAPTTISVPDVLAWLVAQLRAPAPATSVQASPHSAILLLALFGGRKW